MRAALIGSEQYPRCNGIPPQQIAQGNHGPHPPFASWLSAAVQLHQTGHSSIVQHFRRVKVGRADQVTIGRIQPKVCCRVEQINKRSIFEECEALQRSHRRSWIGPVNLARRYSREARLAQLAPSVEHQTQVAARGALVQSYFRQEGWRAHT